MLSKPELSEDDLTDVIYNMLSNLRTSNDRKSRKLFKFVVKNNIPVWTAIKQVPAAAFFISNSEYTQTKFNYTTTVTIIIYLYNRYTSSSLSSDDILSPLIQGVRRGVTLLKGPAVVYANVVNTKRDGGAVHPYTIAELTLEVQIIEPAVCI